MVLGVGEESAALFGTQHPTPNTYSYLSAIIGSTRVARRAGMQMASSAIKMGPRNNLQPIGPSAFQSAKAAVAGGVIAQGIK